MKKITTSLLITLTLSLCLGLSACSKKEAAPETPAQELCQKFKAIEKSNADISLEDLSFQLVETLPFAPAVMPVEEGYLNGFADEIKGFSEGVIFGPMIGSIPFIGYVFRTEDSKALIDELKSKADLRWNVCTQADEMVADSVKNTVFFVMAPLSFDEE